MRTLLIVGARPQFIKAAAIIRAMNGEFPFTLLHTGQHYDQNMSDVFFRELGIPEPDMNLGIHRRSRGAQIGAMLAGIETAITRERPDWVLVFGDTNSTLAGALAAVSCDTRLAHVEAGLRSYNRRMPEEINRVLSDHISDLLFCPSQTAVDNLAKEGIRENVHLVGDLMMDVLLVTREQAFRTSTIIENLDLVEKSYLVVTIHRSENTDDVARLEELLHALIQIQEPVIFPLHPRTRKALDDHGLFATIGREERTSLRFIEPLGYPDMVRLVASARMVLTDSGGLQKEAYWLGVPCVTMREETEWVETVQSGWNVLVGINLEKIIQAVRGFTPPKLRPSLYGDGRTAKRCIEILQAS